MISQIKHHLDKVLTRNYSKNKAIQPISVLFVDMNMPRMQGDEAIQNIKDLYEEKRRTYEVELLDPQYIILTAFLDLAERGRLKR